MRAPAPMTLLDRALTASALAAGCTIGIDRHVATPWHSATFGGSRHDIHLSGATTPALEDWLDNLPETDFTLRRHLVADLTTGHIERGSDSLHAQLSILLLETD